MPAKSLKVLVACECSGTVRDAFLDYGHDAYSCDLVPSDSFRESRRHIIGDALNLIGEEWDLVIAHPPCTFLCNSGVRWLHTQPGRFELMRQAAVFFKTFFAANAKALCIENPIPHKYAMEIINSRYTQLVQPWQFGHGETKATCFWLRGLPLLKPTNIVPGRDHRIHRLPPGKNRSKIRAITYSGIALAMAQQWGGHEIIESGFTSYNSVLR